MIIEKLVIIILIILSTSLRANDYKYYYVNGILVTEDEYEVDKLILSKQMGVKKVLSMYTPTGSGDISSNTVHPIQDLFEVYRQKWSETKLLRWVFDNVSVHFANDYYKKIAKDYYDAIKEDKSYHII